MMIDDQTRANRRINMLNLMMQHENFLVVGLTGRIGAGCSEAADILGSSFRDLNLSLLTPGTNGFYTDEERDLRILQRYASAHWLKFDVIKVRTIITTFLLDHEKMKLFIDYLVCEKGMEPDEIVQKRESVCNKLFEKITKHFSPSEKSTMDNPLFDAKKAVEGPLSEEDAQIESSTFEDAVHYLCQQYQFVNDQNDRVVSRYIGGIEKELEKCSWYIASKIISECDNFEALLSRLIEINNSLDLVSQNTNPEKYAFVSVILPYLSDILRETVKEHKIPFTALFQKYGNSLRYYGEIPNHILEDDINARLQIPLLGKESRPSDSIFAIPHKINQFIKVLRHPSSGETSRPVRIAIDSIKNPFEATYLRQRYSAFYLIAVSSSEKVRIDRLLLNRDKQSTMQEITFDGWGEYASLGKKKYFEYAKVGDSIDREIEAYYRQVTEGRPGFLARDTVRILAYESNQQHYYLQDVPSSIENADIFINNNLINESRLPNKTLTWAIVRNISLIMFPGLLLPTPEERCMQIAFSAKCNSGCLSRQVGAVVTDKNYNILSIGWNDVPCGDISCARKNLVDVCKLEDESAYSDYELHDKSFRERLTRFNYRDADLGKKLRGLPARYCFKDLHQEQKNPMRSRSMHAEEKALALCGDRAEGGNLFTTSSPCEMCSKNAKNHQIKNIYYIEVYPGISETQYSLSGIVDNRAEHHLFTGAVGRAYVQMYTPIMPQKDILAYLGLGWPWEKNK